MMAIWLLRVGARRSHYLGIMAARHIFAPLVFATNMTKYQELHARDFMLHCYAPAQVKDFLHHNQSYSENGESRAEGGDFRLEVRNRQLSRMLGKGVPSNEKWLLTCRNLDYLLNVSNY